MERVILKLSGQALSSNGQGLSISKIHEIALEIKELKNLPTSIGIVCGAGNMWRGRDSQSNHMDRVLADNIGMLGTVMNALAIQNALEEIGLKAVTLSATKMDGICRLYSRDICNEYLEKDYIVIFAGGIGNPYFSTDTTAVLRALEIHASTILMAKNGTDGVYDADPNVDEKAHKYQTLTYTEIIDKDLKVMDLTAAILASTNDVKTIVFDMNHKGNIKNALLTPSVGTIISND
jgi:uridylate kinase